jgi:hypothetical protein
MPENVKRPTPYPLSAEDEARFRQLSRFQQRRVVNLARRFARESRPARKGSRRPAR